ncbi:hypothetical protein K491DRAFT_679628 [Lophiostoma macrostomum CBS 122681]|uniref:Uncharacterized protein n=1 Tax=Lophiostoma macrostomum CBS 122681 TaxID=1314788 RepID=A0A6A6T6K9_9PLEO|nr:hypothetical protein K491DRAFT_679628 [Lophiostoma macrostomum CBS 122681]
MATSLTSEKRQTDQCGWNDIIALVGNGNPRRSNLHKQVTEVIECAKAESCEVGHESIKSFTIGASITAGDGEFATLGFDVSETRSTGETYTCVFVKGQKGCVKYLMPHISYDAQHWLEGSCGLEFADPVYTIRAPSSKEGHFYCWDDCGYMGDENWEEV